MPQVVLYALDAAGARTELRAAAGREIELRARASQGVGGLYAELRNGRGEALPLSEAGASFRWQAAGNRQPPWSALAVEGDGRLVGLVAPTLAVVGTLRGRVRRVR
jgi:hypothetical protein